MSNGAICPVELDAVGSYGTVDGERVSAASSIKLRLGRRTRVVAIAIAAGVECAAAATIWDSHEEAVELGDAGADVDVAATDDESEGWYSANTVIEVRRLVLYVISYVDIGAIYVVLNCLARR